MKEIIDKLTSYNLFNYLLPGTIFVVTLDGLNLYSFTQENLIIGAFVYYFVGLVISRFGSLVVEPFLKKVKFVKFVDYKRFVTAKKKDEQIELFSEINNMYRTFIAMFVLFFVAMLYKIIEDRLPALGAWDLHILIFALFVMLLYSYKKQTEYINKRVKTTEQ